MPFFDEQLALADDAALVPTVSVSDRILPAVPDPGEAEFNNFLQAFSDLLSTTAVYTPDGSVRPAIFPGLVAIERQLVAKSVARAKAAGLLPRPPEDLAPYIGRRSENAIWDAASRANFEPLVKGLVSEVLTDIEHQYNLLPADRSRAVTLSGLVTTDKFRSKLLEAGLTWKDPGAGIEHGEFTHRIQWCAGALMLGAAFPNLRAHFMRIGAFVDQNVFNGTRFGLWDAIADRNETGAIPITPYTTNQVNDFRSPENFSKHLRDPAYRLPTSKIQLLASFVFARYELRYYRVMARQFGGTGTTRPTAAQWNSWSRVLFGNQVVAGLTGPQLATLARAWFRLRTLAADGAAAKPIMIVKPKDQIRPAVVPVDLKNAYDDLNVPFPLRVQPPMPPARII